MYSQRLSEIHSVFENGLQSKVLKTLYFSLNCGVTANNIKYILLPLSRGPREGQEEGERD